MTVHEHDVEVIIDALSAYAFELSGSAHPEDRDAEQLARDLADDLRSGELELRQCSEAEPSDGPGWRDVPVVLFTLAFAAVAYGAGGWPW